MINNNNYVVILYNDPINKRAYVQGVLMEVFNWDEMKANSVMMQVKYKKREISIELSLSTLFLVCLLWTNPHMSSIYANLGTYVRLSHNWRVV